MNADDKTGTATASHEEAEGGERNGSQADTATPGNGDGQPVKPKVRRVESKADRFRRLAVKRMNVALKMIGRVAALGSKASYEYSLEQAAKIIAALKDAVDVVRVRMTSEQKREDGFSL